ncbi:MAG: hypothetical protein FWH55_06000 [Oscillospiraceae bacterium]|nr:hypothetical protein [Oscillospiraceae bacterium]
MTENPIAEFNQEYYERVNKTLLSFLNTEGGAFNLVLPGSGANNTDIGAVIDAETNRLVSRLSESIAPDPSGFISITPERRDGKTVLKISVRQGDSKPYCLSAFGLTPKGVFIRAGNNAVMATREQIFLMIKDSGSGQFIAELSLDQNLTFEYIDKVFADKHVKLGRHLMQSFGMMRPDGRYTNLALIFSEQCPYTTKVAVFEGADRETVKDRREFTGSLLKQFEDVTAYLLLYNRTRESSGGNNVGAGTVGVGGSSDRVGGGVAGNAIGGYVSNGGVGGAIGSSGSGGAGSGGSGVGFPDYRESIIRAAYVNALIHRDYEIEGSIFVNMFSNRLEITSLGDLMPGVTHDLMLAGVSIVRNESLVQLMSRLGIIEACGTGIPRIFDAYGKTAVKPEIPEINGGFLIRLPNMNYLSLHTKDHVAGLSTHEQRLIAAFPDASFNKEDAAMATGLSVSGAYKLLVRMREQGAITAYKSGKQWLYTVK